VNPVILRLGAACLAAVLILLSTLRLEQDRAGLAISDFDLGATPVTQYQLPDATGPIVIVAHGFAGSRQIMQSYSLGLAQAGYRVLAFDFAGHGRNAVPMSGDVTSVDGTTALLVAQTSRVIAAARAMANPEHIAILGLSMATDIILRANLAQDQPLDSIVAISMFSQVVTAQSPKNLLIISGEWEGFLRQAGLDAMHQLDPTVAEGAMVTKGDILRKTFVAPMVEHVGVLFSASAVQAAIDWLDFTFGIVSDRHPTPRGGAILALLVGIVIALYPLVALLPKTQSMPTVPTRRFWVAVIGPAVLTPLILTPFYQNFLPVLVADYLMLHLALFGLLQIAVLGRGNLGQIRIGAVALLGFWGILVFGLALDRYAAGFWPNPARLMIILALCLGTVPAMMGDSLATLGAHLWRRVVARLSLLTSLGLAAALDPENLTFVLIVLPVFALFFLVHGWMGRWVGQRSGAGAAGIGLGLCLAWALGVSFPLFVSP
jgi:pimeloyl-ACP methyl ester carboxylesterase